MLIALGVGLVMTFLATRTRFGRYVYATGGNPEAAELAGINTKWLTVKVFALMGVLVGRFRRRSRRPASTAATNALGQFDELYVIAAAVIGGTSLAGGVGTIYGAMLGALVMQSLQSGMTLLNFESAYQGHRGRLRAGPRRLRRPGLSPPREVRGRQRHGNSQAN